MYTVINIGINRVVHNKHGKKRIEHKSIVGAVIWDTPFRDPEFSKAVTKFVEEHRPKWSVTGYAWVREEEGTILSEDVAALQDKINTVPEGD